ncbi:hypothetical protein [Pararhodonellum marinum]|uniref:hypothetical protein n=1 Tax=Pararhodonellum marinum TaxID=2755358 RepID=UPI00188E0412|nr:hypothetical protein [Pararhodonellum marinum]
MKSPIIYLIVLLFFQTQSFAQSDEWHIAGFTPVENIKILDELAEGKDMLKGDQIFAKARGFFSFSPINSINNRALTKLRTEASMKGASHIYISYRSIENSWFSKTSMYTARIFKESPVTFQEVSQAVKGKKMVLKVETKYSRDQWRATTKEVNETSNINLNAPLEEKDGKVLIKLRTKDFKSGKYSEGEFYEVIALEGNRMIVTKEIEKETGFLMYGVEIQ